MTQLQGEAKACYVARMFGRIARRYDLLNTVMTGGMHHRWRRQAAHLAARHLEGIALDVATGTGDFAFALLREPGVHRVVALDFVSPMLHLAGAKAIKKAVHRRVHLVQGDALELPFPNGSFLCATSGFSLRNVVDAPQALREMARVVQPGGRVAIVEITPLQRRTPWRWFFRWYFHHITPLLGALLSGDREAYTYLPRSVDIFPAAPQLAALMEDAGLQEVTYRYLGWGTVALHVGVVRDS